MRDHRERDSWLIDLGWVAGMTALAFVLRVIYGSKHILIYNDSAGYILRAMDIFSGGSLFDPFKGPGYPLMIGFWAKVLGGDYILGAKVASMVSGSLLVLVAYLLGKKLYGRSVAITASLLIAINTALIEVATRELTEATYTIALFSAVAVTVWAARRKNLVLWALAGFLFGFSYWVRPEGFFYLGLIPIFAFIKHWVQTRKPFSRNFALRMSVFLLAGFLMAIPYILHIHRETGSWTINGRTVWAALVFSKHLDRASLEGQLAYEKDLFQLTPDKQSTMLEGGFKRISVFSNYMKNVVLKTRDMIKNWIKTYELLPSVFTLILVLFMGIGLSQLKWTFQDRLAEFYLVGALLPWVFVYPLYEIDFENLTPIVPILTLWASLGIVSTAARVSPEPGTSRSFVFPKPAVVIVGILLLVAFFESPPYIRLVSHPGFVIRKDEDDLANLKVAEWIRESLPEDTTIMVRKLFIGAYANRKTVVLPFADYKDVISYARLKGVDVIVMDEKFKQLRPQLAFLFDEHPGYLEDLIPIFTTENDKGQKIILYKVLPEKHEQTLYIKDNSLFQWAINRLPDLPKGSCLLNRISTRSNSHSFFYQDAERNQKEGC
ncbi:MAG: ArnT family glycosyltransferase [Thermodesulfobacteriota bacterium]